MAALRATASLAPAEIAALMDWAEWAFPQYFPVGTGSAGTADPFTYRHYGATGNYVGISDSGQVALYGPVSGGALQVVGTTADFGCKAAPEACGAGTWRRVSTTTFPIDGGILASAIANRGDESLLVLNGVGSDRCETLPFRAIRLTPQGVFDASQRLAQATPATHAREIVAADFDGDGLEDIFSANHGCDYQSNPMAGSGERNALFLGTATGFSDRSATLPAAAAFTHSAAAADVDGDGDADILVADLHLASYLLVNDGHGSFTPRADLLPAAMLDNTTQYTAVLFADVDGDGAPDLVTGTMPESDDVAERAGHVYLNRGGSFRGTPRGALPPGLFGPRTTVLDIKALRLGGRQHLVLLETADYQNFKLQIVANRGLGLFEDQTEALLPAQKTGASWPAFVHVADINGDGLDDLVLQHANFAPNPDDPVAYVFTVAGRYRELTRAELPADVRGLMPARIGGQPYLLSVRNGDLAGLGVVELYTNR
ncbi:FG-GAP repeat domain-containing protein [Ramlibacter sp.]|uniref:FG-GAP repeat domain-containing protein n=1 Tax=Ramlibacter sp. TaxID=1917967 RepID=UPI002D14B6EA|nr:FG-GAP-like repeat-containing protein [Ramlibacter sp.]HWI83636.1 FG-GAP-like repeat-containing protein [Ramlibacter sp.]